MAKTQEKEKPKLPFVQQIDEHKHLSPFIGSLLFDEPFFGQIARHVDFIADPKVETAGVGVKDCDIVFLWAPEFLSALTNLKVRGLIKHEFFHIAFNHCTTRQLKPHSVANLAADLAINCAIPAEELPNGGWVPGDLHLDMITGLPPTDPKELELAQLVASFPRNESMEWYFTELMKSDVIKEMLKKAKAAGLEDIIIEGFDSHEGWGKLTPEEQELVKGKVREMIRKAVSEADKHNQWGKMPAEMIGQLRSLISNEIDWTAVLRQFVKTSKRGHTTTTWSNLHMSNLHETHGPATPGKKHSFTSRVAVYVDESGSMSDDDLALLFSELGNFTRRTEFPTYVFDTEVDERSKIDWKPKRGTPAAALKRIRCGGTDFTAPTKHANSGKIKGLDGYLILTDGGAAKPPPSKIKRGYVIVPGQQLAFEPDPDDFVIMMKREVKKN